MTGLDGWLTQATRTLAKASAAQVRTEIQEHYEASRDAAIAGGATAGEAERVALQALGDAKTANRQYREVLLTSAEARILRQGNCEARALCFGSRKWFPLVPVGAMAVAAALFLTGHAAVARDLLIGAIGMSPTFVAPLLPVYTLSRSRVFRVVRWLAMAAAIALLFGPSVLKWSALLFSCLWPVAWSEWTRASIRRKLPIAVWPKHLYL